MQQVLSADAVANSRLSGLMAIHVMAKLCAFFTLVRALSVCASMRVTAKSAEPKANTAPSWLIAKAVIGLGLALMTLT